MDEVYILLEVDILEDDVVRVIGKYNEIEQAKEWVEYYGKENCDYYVAKAFRISKKELNGV